MSILLFNWAGYRLALDYLQSEADHQLQTRIDLNDYDESQLVEIRVALNMPYQATSTEFERHYGEIELSGKHYTYVKRKIDAGFLVLQCIPNTAKDKIEYTGKAVFEANNNLDQQNSTTPSPQAKVFKNFAPEFDNDKYNFQLRTQIIPVIHYSIAESSLIQTGFKTICEQPPDLTFIS